MCPGALQSHLEHRNLPERHRRLSDHQQQRRCSPVTAPNQRTPEWSHHWRKGWSHDWRKGGPITLAELLPSGPMPLAGDRGAQCQLNSKEISPNPEKTLDDPLVHP